MSVHSRYRAGLWHPYEKPMCGVLLNPYHPLARGLVGCWLFNEGGGSIVYDLSGHGNHGTLGGGTAGYCPAWTTGKFGSALNFDDDFISIPHDASFDVDTVTVIAWFKATASGAWMKIVCHPYYDDQWSDPCVVYALSIDKQNEIISEISTEISNYKAYGPVLSINTWYFAALTWDGEVVKTYVNGIHEGSTYPSGSLNHRSTKVHIAKAYDAANTELFNGVIDSVMIYNRALSAKEIWQLYTDPFCMFYHPFEAELLYTAAPPAGIVPQAMHHYRMLRT